MLLTTTPFPVLLPSNVSTLPLPATVSPKSTSAKLRLMPMPKPPLMPGTDTTAAPTDTAILTTVWDTTVDTDILTTDTSLELVLSNTSAPPPPPTASLKCTNVKPRLTPQLMLTSLTMVMELLPTLPVLLKA